MRIENWQFEEETESEGPKLVATFDNGQCLNLVARKDDSGGASELHSLLALLKQHIVAIEPD